MPSQDDARRALTLVSDAAADLIEQASVSELAALVQAVGEVYGDAAAVLAADWYDLERDAAAVRSAYVAESAPLPDESRYVSLLEWAAATATDEVAQKALVAGGVRRVVSNAHRDTVLLNVAKDPAKARWGRKARADACSFCRMLVTRGNAYTSRDAALLVGGGGRVRGTRAAGQRYHDNCHCLVVPSWE